MEKEYKLREWQAEREGEGEADTPLSREPNMGLSPRTLRSYLSRRQMLNRLSPPGIPHSDFSTCTFNLCNYPASPICIIGVASSALQGYCQNKSKKRV